MKITIFLFSTAGVIEAIDRLLLDKKFEETKAIIDECDHEFFAWIPEHNDQPEELAQAAKNWDDFILFKTADILYDKEIKFFLDNGHLSDYEDLIRETITD